MRTNERLKTFLSTLLHFSYYIETLRIPTKILPKTREYFAKKVGELLSNLGYNTCTNSLTTFTNSEVKTLLHSDRREKLYGKG